MALSLTDSVEKAAARLVGDAAKQWFAKLIQPQQYVGEVYSIGYSTALVQVHDFQRQKVGGIPSLSFLIATRINPEAESQIDFAAEDSAVILLRVLDSAPLPQDVEAERIRVESAQHVTGELSVHWDGQQAMDAQTAHLLSFAGLKCRVIGTFFLEPTGGQGPTNTNLQLRFGSDLANFYPNRGLKVFKPTGEALSVIVNYQDPDRLDKLASFARVPIGGVRYASTNRAFQGVGGVEVSISPADLLAQKTALFAMTRVGKSNTVKVIAKSVFNLRFDATNPVKIGQLIFDPNGEYAQENVQDATQQRNPSALKNVWQQPGGLQADVVTYGLHSNPRDPSRKLVLINFYEDAMLDIGKEMIDTALSSQNVSQAQYLQSFRLVRFQPPDQNLFPIPGEYQGALTRYSRRVLVYRTLLKKAGFGLPANLKQPSSQGLFKQELLARMTAFQAGPRGKDQDKVAAIHTAAATLTKPQPSWDALADAFTGLLHYLGTDDFADWDTKEYIPKSSSGESWADDDLKRLLGMFAYPKAVSLLALVKDQHATTTVGDYADAIYAELVAGRLVIFDQSGEESVVTQSAAERILWRIFLKQQEEFKAAREPANVLVYIEEAHNLLPPGSEEDTKNIWAKTAKEGGKYNVGMVYATQEPSSIQTNILKATANWFIGHLNNTDETRVVSKHYDFEDFAESLIRAQDRGFLRVKTLSNLFTVPVQIFRFEV